MDVGNRPANIPFGIQDTGKVLEVGVPPSTLLDVLEGSATRQ